MQQSPHWLQIYPQNCPFPFDDYNPRLIHPFLDRPNSPPQTASGSNQPFRQKLPEYTLRSDRQTDRQMVQANVPYHARSASYANRERRAKNDIVMVKKSTDQKRLVTMHDLYTQYDTTKLTMNLYIARQPRWKPWGAVSCSLRCSLTTSVQ